MCGQRPCSEKRSSNVVCKCNGAWMEGGGGRLRADYCVQCSAFASFLNFVGGPHSWTPQKWSGLKHGLQ